MIVKVTKDEVYPVYNKDDSGRAYAIRTEIDVDPRVWEDYKLARDKFMKLRRKVLEADNKQTRKEWKSQQ